MNPWLLRQWWGLFRFCIGSQYYYYFTLVSSFALILALTLSIILYLNPSYFHQNLHLLRAKLRIRPPQRRGFLSVTLASITASHVTSKGSSQRRSGWKMQAERSKTTWLSSRKAGTMAALWLLTGGPLKFTNILYKTAKWLCIDSSSPAHGSVCTCMLTRRPRLLSAQRGLAVNMNTVSITQYHSLDLWPTRTF